MSQVFQGTDRVAVTVVAVGQQTVAQIRTQEKDGYSAVQIGYGKGKKGRKSLLGHAKKAGSETSFRTLKEFRTPEEGYAVGQKLTTTMFAVGDMVAVTGTSKGRGFQGVVKRWGFAGSLATHGHKDQHRMPGSVGATGNAHVYKGTRMGGHMGSVKNTMRNLKIVGVDAEQQLLLLKGAVPGARGGLVAIMGEGVPVVEEQSQEAPQEAVVEPKKEAVEEKNAEGNKDTEMTEPVEAPQEGADHENEKT